MFLREKVTQRKRQVKATKRDCWGRWRERRRWRGGDVGYLEGEAQLKKTKHYCCLATLGQAGCLSVFPLSHTQIHTGGRGDASVGTKVFPLCKLKPLITNWEKRGRMEVGDGRWIEGREKEREGDRQRETERERDADGDLEIKICDLDIN